MREHEQGEVRDGKSCAHGVSGAGPARAPRCACHDQRDQHAHTRSYTHTHAEHTYDSNAVPATKLLLELT